MVNIHRISNVEKLSLRNVINKYQIFEQPEGNVSMNRRVQWSCAWNFEIYLNNFNSEVSVSFSIVDGELLLTFSGLDFLFS